MLDDLEVSPQELGMRLSDARRSAGMSQEEVARSLGVSRPTLVSIEKGSRPAKPEELIKLAGLFGRSIHDLSRKGAFTADFMPHFRITQSSDVPDSHVEEAVKTFRRICEDYVKLEKLLKEPTPRHQYPGVYVFESLSAAAAAEEIAQQERSRLNLGAGPLPDLVDVLESDIGLRVFVLPLSEFRIAGMFYFSTEWGGCILVNGNHPYTRQRWTLAHEFGHFLVDRYREDVNVFVEYERKPRSEQFADAFAASFLMPATGVRQRFRKIVQTRGDFKVADLCRLADQYGVSVEAMTRRLEGLECVRRGMWDSLSQQITVSRVREHLGLSAPASEQRRLPERYRQLAVQAFEEEEIGETELMQLLRCTRVEARETVDALTRTSEIGASGAPYQLSLKFSDLVPVDAAERS